MIWKIINVILTFVPDMITEGNDNRSLLLFSDMNTDHQKEAIAQKVTDLIAGHPSHFLVEVRIKPTNNVKVFVDADEGISLSDLIDYNRKLYKQLEGSGLFPNDDFSLEVSSPGLDEPLKLHRQYRKNIGRYVEIMLLDGAKREGKLLEAMEDGIVIEMESGKGKKKEIKTESVLFDNIKNTKIQVKF